VTGLGRRKNCVGSALARILGQLPHALHELAAVRILDAAQFFDQVA